MQNEMSEHRRELKAKDEDFEAQLVRLRLDRDSERAHDAQKLAEVQAELEEQKKTNVKNEKDSIEDKQRLKLGIEAKLANNAKELQKQR